MYVSGLGLSFRSTASAPTQTQTVYRTVYVNSPAPAPTQSNFAPFAHELLTTNAGKAFAFDPAAFAPKPAAQTQSSHAIPLAEPEEKTDVAPVKVAAEFPWKLAAVAAIAALLAVAVISRKRRQ